MLAALRAGQGWRALMRRGLAAARDVTDEVLEEAMAPDSSIMHSHKKRDRRLRYLVMQQDLRSTRAALALLEQSVYRLPLAEPRRAAPATGAATAAGFGAELHPTGSKYLKLPPPSVCNKVINASAQEPDLVPKAAELADALALQGVGLENRTLQSLLTGLARAGLVAEALPLLDMWLQQQEEALADEANTAVPQAVQVLTQLLEAAARNENTQLVLQVLARMAGVGLMPTAQSMTSLLQCFARLGQHATALTILDWMKRSEMPPNVFSYTALLTMAAHASEAGVQSMLSHAKQAYARMREEGVQPNARFYTALLRVFGRARDGAAAQQAWQDMRAAGVEPDLILYSTMFDTCAKCRNGGAALAVYGEMRDAGVTPDVVAYSSLLSALHGSPAASAEARALWASMQEAGVRPNGRAIAAYLDLLLSVGETDEALGLLTDAAGLLGRGRGGGRAGAGAGHAAGVVIDLPRIYEHFIHVLASRGQFELVEHLARHRRAARLPQTKGIASALLTAQALRHQRTAAKWLLQEEEWQPEGSLEEQASLNARRQAAMVVPEPVVEACLLGRGSAEALAQQVMGQGNLGGPLSPAVVNVVIGGLAVQGLGAQAFSLYDWLTEQGMRPGAAAPAGLAPDWWTYRLLLYAGLNAVQADQRFDLVLRALAASRKHAREARSRGAAQPAWWDQKTRRAVLGVLQQSDKAAQLLGGHPAVEAGEEHEQRMAQLKALLGQKAA